MSIKQRRFSRCIALVLSLVTGFVAGIRWNVVLVRSVMLMAVFAGIGFGICLIIQEVCPRGIPAAVVHRGGAAGDRSGRSGYRSAGDRERKRQPAGKRPCRKRASKPGRWPPRRRRREFTELEKEGLAHYSTAAGGTSVNTKSGKLGKHILEKEKMAKYEPKIMAQAVRTMMSKDRE